jgi:hypothetical protein
MAKVYTLTMTENERLPPTLRGINRREVKYGLILLGEVRRDGVNMAPLSRAGSLPQLSLR